MTRASACGSSWLSVESRRVALATIATPSRADAPRRRPVAAVRHATAAEAPATHWAGRQKARAALASATRLMSESDRASFAAFDVEFVVEISRCRAPLHRSTTQAHRPAADVELYSSTALYSALQLYSSTALYTLHPLHPPSSVSQWRLRGYRERRVRDNRMEHQTPSGFPGSLWKRKVLGTLWFHGAVHPLHRWRCVPRGVTDTNLKHLLGVQSSTALRSAPSGPDDWHRVAGKRALAPGVRVRRERAVK